MRSTNRISHIAVACLALVVGCATGVAVNDLIVPARAAPGSTYEYFVIDVQASWGMTGGNAETQTAALNQYGAEGWHVVGSVGNKLYLERERASQ